MDEIEHFQYIEDMNRILEFIYAHFITPNSITPCSLNSIRQTIQYSLHECNIREIHRRFISEMRHRKNIPDNIYMNFSNKLHCVQWWISEWNTEIRSKTIYNLVNDIQKYDALLF